MLAFALAAALAATPAAEPPLVPWELPGRQASRVSLFTADDAPVPSSTCAVSALVGVFTGLAVMVTAGVGTPAGVNPTFDAAILARVSAGALLISVSPGLGDLANGLTDRFLLRAGLRTALAGLLIAWVALGTAAADSASVAFALLGAVFLGGGWFVWSVVDAAMASRAPQRWAERQQERARSPSSVRAELPSDAPRLAWAFRF